MFVFPHVRKSQVKKRCARLSFLEPCFPKIKSNTRTPKTRKSSPTFGRTIFQFPIRQLPSICAAQDKTTSTTSTQPTNPQSPSPPPDGPPFPPQTNPQIRFPQILLQPPHPNLHRRPPPHRRDHNPPRPLLEHQRYPPRNGRHRPHNPHLEPRAHLESRPS